jgi:Xaa-Pro aminopeptidase
VLNKIQAKLSEHEIDALLVLSPANRQYATDFKSSAGLILITRNAGYVLTDFRYIEAAKTKIQGYTVEMSTKDKKNADWLKEWLAAHGIKTLGFEQGFISVGAHKDYAEKLAGVELKPAGELLNGLRQVKEPWEVERMAAAQRLAERTLEEVLPLIRPGLTERRLAAEIIYRSLCLGSEKVPFEPIAVSGPNSALPHGVPGDRAFERGDTITMDFGCTVGGYCSDMTRTVVLGKASEEVRLVYQTVLAAQKAGIAAAKPGVAGKDVDEAARAVIRDAGHGERFGHGFGHGIGVEVHEEPTAGTLGEKAIPAGAVITAEPGIYMPGQFGIRIEDMLYVTEEGTVNLTQAPKELLEI